MNSKHFWYAFPKKKQNDGRCVYRFIGTMKHHLEFGGLVKLHQLWTEVLINACRCCFPQAENIKYTRTHTHTKLTRRFEHAHVSYIYRQIYTCIYIYTYVYIYIHHIYININKYIHIYIQHVLIVLILPIFLWGCFFPGQWLNINPTLIKVSLSFFQALGCGFRWVWGKDLFFFGGENLLDRLILFKRKSQDNYSSRKSTLAVIHAWRIGPHDGGYVVNNYGDRKSPKDPGCSTSKWPNFMVFFPGVILTTYKSWDDPPSHQRSRVSKRQGWCRKHLRRRQGWQTMWLAIFLCSPYDMSLKKVHVILMVIVSLWG